MVQKSQTTTYSMYETLQMMGYTTNLNWCRISAMNRRNHRGRLSSQELHPFNQNQPTWPTLFFFANSWGTNCGILMSKNVISHGICYTKNNWESKDFHQNVSRFLSSMKALWELTPPKLNIALVGRRSGFLLGFGIFSGVNWLS